MRTQSFVITGMTCANCVNTVSKTLNQSEQVIEATVNLATERAKVSVEDGMSDREIIGLVESAGYGAIVNDKAHQEKILQEQETYSRRLMLSFWTSVILTLPVLLAMGGRIMGIHTFDLFHQPLVQLLLATPVQFIIGSRFYRGAFHALKSKSANMDVLVALGTSVAYFSSLILAVTMGNMSALNFESSMVIITLVLMGKVLEHHAKDKTNQAIQSLMSNRESSVNTLSGIKRIEDVQVGESIHILAGEKVPLDVEIERGQALFDESALTGEDLPISKEEGDTVFEGAVNLDGEIIARVLHHADDSTVARMTELMAEAQGIKPNIQKLADKISSIFVPAVLMIALLTFIITWLITSNLLTAIMHAVATLVIACPCALGLATPTAIISGTGLAAKNGLLIKNINALELAKDIKTVYFDKTGTLTSGEFILDDFEGTDSSFQILASLEEKSNHPLAKIIKAEHTLSVKNIKEISGQGLSGIIEGKRYYAGNAKLMNAIGIAVTQAKNTVVYVADENQLLGVATFKSLIKTGSQEVVQDLQLKGIQTVMLTGDNAQSASLIQKQLKLDKVMSDCSPEDKARIVQETPYAMMVGDGINDVVALASSTIGMTMATGSDIAMEAGDVTVMGGHIQRVSDFFLIASKTMNKIKQNYFWAFIYNVIGIPLAAFGLLNPMFAAATMSLSSVSVILNSLLLSQAKIKKAD